LEYRGLAISKKAQQQQTLNRMTAQYPEMNLSNAKIM